MSTPALDSLPIAIHAAPQQLVLALTGGGSGALAALLQTPGASRTILEAIVPYSAASLADWLGSPAEQACSSATSRAMAMVAWRRAGVLAGTPSASLSAARNLLGVAATASLATDRAKRGAHRVHVAVQSNEATSDWHLTFDAKERDRATEERLTALLILTAIASASDLDASDALRELREQLAPVESLDQQSHTAEPSWSELLVGMRRMVRLGAATAAPSVVFPGAFNPIHAGHLKMARLAEQRLGAKASWELSIENVDKPPLDFLTIGERVQGLAEHDVASDVVLTRAPTFREKAALFPGATFVVGADTMARLADVRYYQDLADRDAAISTLAERHCRFLVFGRQREAEFETLGDLALPSSLRAICDGVSPADFRVDLSSTELR